MIFVRRLVWDNLNVVHIARHEVIPEEVEEVCHGKPLVLQSYKDRLVFIGPTAAGRMLAVILDPEGKGMYYPVTARPASRKERALYRQEMQVEEGGDKR